MSMTRTIGTLLSLSVAVALSLGLAACKKKIDSDKLEDNIREEIKKQIGMEPTDVSCPDDVEEKKGESFTCTVKADDDSTATVKVEMLGDGNVSWEVMPGATAPSGGGNGEGGGGGAM